MDQHQSAQQNQSLKNSAKGSRQVLALTLAITCLIACSSKKVVPAGLGSPANPKPAKALDISSTLGAKLTTVGENYAPHLSNDGGEFLFLSQKRETHQQPQIYVYNLADLSERRVTYQDGQCDSPIFVKESGDIVYSSTTDEIKERPALLRKDSNNEIPSELYLSDINGSSIRRLTRHPGFDGDPVEKPGKGNFIYFSQQSEGGAKKIMQISIVSEATASVLSKKGVSIEEFTPAPGGKEWLWKEINLADHIESIWLAEKVTSKAQVVNLPKGQYQNFSWIDDSHLLLSGKLEDKKTFQLMTYETDKKCLRAFLSDKSNLTEPQLTSNQRSLIFVSDISGKRQIYYRSVSIDWTAPCLNQEPVPTPVPVVVPTSTTSTSTTTTSTSTTTPAVVSTTTLAPTTTLSQKN